MSNEEPVEILKVTKEDIDNDDCLINVYAKIKHPTMYITLTFKKSDIEEKCNDQV